MKTKRHWNSCLAGLVLLAGLPLGAAPLTWFPGPALDSAVSGAATTVYSGGNNLLIGGDTYSVLALASTNRYWTALTPFYDNAYAPGAVAQGGTITVYGGNDGTSATRTVIGYSSSDGSQILASMSAARAYLGYAPDRNGNAYAFGGLDDSGQPLASAERYNPDNNTWSAIASLPAARYNFPAVFNRTNYISLLSGLKSQ